MTLLAVVGFSYRALLSEAPLGIFSGFVFVSALLPFSKKRNLFA